MDNLFKFASHGTATALIIYFPPTVKGLFNADVHGLVREVQDLLSGVHVSYALSSGSSPDLRDAMAAARFSGCGAMVVVPVGEDDAARFIDAGSKGDWLLTAAPVRAEIDAPALVHAYLNAVDEAGRAA